MERVELERRLEVAERNVALGDEAIAEQRLAVSATAAWGTDPVAALDALRAMEMLQQRLLDDLETARVQLESHVARAWRDAG
jgi:hypothetical protein